MPPPSRAVARPPHSRLPANVRHLDFFGASSLRADFRVAIVAGPAEMSRKIDDAVVVDAAPDNSVDFDRLEANLYRVVDRLENAPHGKLDIIHVAKDAIVERVEADRDSCQAGIPERLRFLPRQQR